MVDYNDLNLRYSKQILFKPIGIRGQEKLLKSFVVIVGCGGLGSALSNNMVRAGIGKIRIMDNDIVELNNLQRQLLYDEVDVRKKTPKVIAAKEKLSKINSNIDIEGVVDELSEKNSKNYLRGADLVLDATDNFKTRLIINNYCVKNKIPWIYGAVAGGSGMIYNVIPGRNKCFKCLFREEPPEDMIFNCNTIGIINSIVTTVASIQSTEAFKLLTGNQKMLSDGLINIDLWSLSLKILKINKEKNYKCPVCNNI